MDLTSISVMISVLLISAQWLDGLSAGMATPWTPKPFTKAPSAVSCAGVTAMGSVGGEPSGFGNTVNAALV